MRPLAALIAIFTICTAGFGLAVHLLGLRGKIRLPELAAFSWLFGTAFVSLAMWVMAFFCSDSFLTALVTVACMLTGASGIRVLRKGNIPVEWPERPGLLEALLCAVLAIQFLVVLWIAAGTSMAWDGLFSWEFKARMLFDSHDRFPDAYFANPFWHPDYPLLLPLNEAWLYHWIGGSDQFWVRILFPPFYIVCALVLYIGGSRLSGSRATGLITAIMLFFVPEVLNGPGSFNSGYADFPLAVFYLAAVVQLLLFMRDGTRGALTLFAMLAAMLPWIKRDGSILWFCIILAGGIIAGIRLRKTWPPILMALPGIVIIGTWTVYLKVMNVAKNVDFQPINLATFHQNMGRMVPIAYRLVHELLDTSRWSLVWIGFVPAIVYLTFTKRAKMAALLFLLTALPVLFLCGSYIFSAWANYTRHVDSSLPRLVLETAPVAILTIALALAKPRTDNS